ncbi:4-(cytidine 5'-diphospho)-2-C-methyl-D-erythritol kinase [Pseudopedobacter beijingensis]|uniref:4-diphosphocytidyl-2-C-methyl-D-erythritol kinase n=1 Tax=Pseudopedobacter beijingensis TaxID=1207056 RepID=A0ABW4IH33_9SPHI
MICFPNAKINIGLNVLSRRTDGYHNLETIFYPIKINDALEVIEAAEMGFETSGIPIPGYANENLCLRAYELMRKDFDLPNIRIHLHKNIPIGAGLGGGSSDAAFFIKLINDKFGLEIAKEQMLGYCKVLGADCSFFIENRPVFAQGIGDEFEPLDIDLSPYHLVLVKPDVHVSTGEAYRGVKYSEPVNPLKTLVRLPVEEWNCNIKNDFEPHIFNSHPQIRLVKANLLEAGALFALMSGSGSSVFGVFNEKPDLSMMDESCLVYSDI